MIQAQKENFNVKYDIAYKQYLDTTSLFNDKDSLSFLDSLKLQTEFDKVYFDNLLKGYQTKIDSLKNSYSTSSISVGIAYDWDQLEKLDQNLIKKSSEEYLVKLANNELESFWESCHSKFKESTPFISFKEVGEIISGMIQDIDKVTFIDAKKIDYSMEPAISKFSTGGSIDKENPTYLQFYTIAGISNQALSIYHAENKPLSKAIVIKLGLEKGEYKLTSMK